MINPIANFRSACMVMKLHLRDVEVRGSYLNPPNFVLIGFENYLGGVLNVVEKIIVRCFFDFLKFASKLCFFLLNNTFFEYCLEETF